MEAMEALRQAAGDPKTYARKWKASHGGKVVGTLCSYAPEELILAGGALAYRILGDGGRVTRADAHLQSYSCSLVRGALDDALSGELDFLDGIVFPHTCDTIQRLSDIWRINAKTGFHLDVVLPAKLNTESARAYMTSVLTEAKNKLETLLDKTIGDAELKDAIETYNGIRAAMQRLYTLRSEYPNIVPGSDVHTLLRASMVMDRGEFLIRLTQILELLEPQSADRAAAAKRVFLSGGVCNLPDLYSLIASAGGVVVGDDLCTGSRGLTGLIDTAADPLAAISQRYAGRAICPSKHAGITRRGEELVHQVKVAGAQGVIFIFLKFCDPHGFDYPYLKAMLADEGIPSLNIELGEGREGRGQLETRCGAFIEML
jgi:bcr-type benzoyl-CoA reductase subunit C